MKVSYVRNEIDNFWSNQDERIRLFPVLISKSSLECADNFSVESQIEIQITVDMFVIESMMIVPNELINID